MGQDTIFGEEDSKSESWSLWDLDSLEKNFLSYKAFCLSFSYDRPQALETFSKGRGVVKKEMKLKGVLPWMLVKTGKCVTKSVTV